MNVLVLAANSRSLIANRGSLIAEAVARGLNVGALVPDADYLDEVESLGIPIWKFPMQRTGMNALADLRSVQTLRRLLREIQPEAVFAYGVKPIAYGVPAAHAAGARCYAMVTGLGHVYTTDSLKTRVARALVGRLYRRALGRCEKVFFQNPDDEAEFVTRGILGNPAKAVRTAGSGIDLERFEERPLPSGAPTFLFVGRLLGEKGIAEFFAAATRVKARWPDARFVAVGPHDANLPHAISSAKLEEWRAAGVVEFVGGVSDVRPWLTESSVLVLPSYREGTPRAVLEAMATGRAIITTNAPGCRETVTDGVNGFLVPPRTVEPLAAAMERFMAESALLSSMGAASRRMAEARYDVRMVNSQILTEMGYA